MLCLALSAAAAAAPPPARIDQMAWLAGQWREQGTSDRIDAFLLPPSGGSMAGVFRRVRGGQVTTYALAVVEEAEGSLILRTRTFDSTLPWSSIAGGTCRAEAEFNQSQRDPLREGLGQPLRGGARDIRGGAPPPPVTGEHHDGGGGFRASPGRDGDAGLSWQQAASGSHRCGSVAGGRLGRPRTGWHLRRGVARSLRREHGRRLPGHAQWAGHVLRDRDAGGDGSGRCSSG